MLQYTIRKTELENLKQIFAALGAAAKAGDKDGQANAKNSFDNWLRTIEG